MRGRKRKEDGRKMHHRVGIVLPLRVGIGGNEGSAAYLSFIAGFWTQERANLLMYGR